MFGFAPRRSRFWSKPGTAESPESYFIISQFLWGPPADIGHWPSPFGSSFHPSKTEREVWKFLRKKKLVEERKKKAEQLGLRRAFVVVLGILTVLSNQLGYRSRQVALLWNFLSVSSLCKCQEILKCGLHFIILSNLRWTKVSYYKLFKKREAQPLPTGY